MGVLLDKPIAPDARHSYASGSSTSHDRERAAFEARYTQLCELLPKDRVELVDGRIVVSPVPTAVHNQLAFRILRLLMAVTEERGWEIWNDITLFLGPQQDRYRPDLTVVPPKPRMWGSDHVHGDQVLLVVEVVSPSSVTDDHSIKRPTAPRAVYRSIWSSTRSRRRRGCCTARTGTRAGTPMPSRSPWASR
jgi:Putative restriction endonuclease